MWKKMWNQLKNPDFSCQEPTAEIVDTIVKRLQYLQFEALNHNDWKQENDLRLAEELIKVLWTEREKLQWQLKHGVGTVQTPDCERSNGR